MSQSVTSSQANADGSEPLVAPMAGKVEITDKAAVIAPAGQSVVRYEIPGFKQILVNDGDKIVAGQRLTNGSINLHELCGFRVLNLPSVTS